MTRITSRGNMTRITGAVRTSRSTSSPAIIRVLVRVVSPGRAPSAMSDATSLPFLHVPPPPCTSACSVASHVTDAHPSSPPTHVPAPVASTLSAAAASPAAAAAAAAGRLAREAVQSAAAGLAAKGDSERCAAGSDL